MTLSPGTRLGAYDIVTLIGAGGMGEVYRARDSRLDRTVAIKVLPEALEADARLRERFDREARIIAALNHPHICTVHDVGQEGGVAFLVMELVEGETLADRLQRGALAVVDALRVAVEVASGLQAAHRAGIVHRDLKPGNIMLTKSGAKLLDFGLAKTTSPVAAAGLSMLPTTPPSLTAQGAILGTLHYMAPEQLEGREADVRSDLFAFGAVLYEMLTGRRAFDARNATSLIGAILHTTPPPVSASRPAVPAALDRLVSTCLAKDPDERWQSAGDLVRELKWIGDSLTQPSAAPGAAAPRRRRLWVSIAAAGLVGVALIASAVTYVLLGTRVTPASAGAVRFVVPTPPTVSSFALSPDGRQLVYADSATGGQLYLRSIDVVEPRRLAGTEGARFPFWSPNGRFDVPPS